MVKMSQVPVVHDCNPSYLGGRDQKDFDSMEAQQIVHKTLSPKYPNKSRLAEWLKWYSTCVPSMRS
jgi:hypothetical protein